MLQIKAKIHLDAEDCLHSIKAYRQGEMESYQYLSKTKLWVLLNPLS
jgi:hypothetical protein